MNHVIAIELTDEEFGPIQRAAEATHRTPADVVVAALRRHLRTFEEMTQDVDADTRDEVSSAVAPLAARTGQESEEILARWKGPRVDTRDRHTTEAERQADLDDLLAFGGTVSPG